LPNLLANRLHACANGSKNNMQIFIAKEKHETRYFECNSAEERELISERLIKERLMEKWYAGYHKEAAENALEKGKCFSFLSQRRGYEYEDFDIVEVDKIIK
jgi:hypothetical protein